MKQQGSAGVPDARYRYYHHCALYWLLYAFGIWLSYQAESMLGMAVFVWMLLSSMYQQIPYSKALDEEYHKCIEGVKERQIELTFDDKGLTETECGVVSYCPWTSVTSYRLFDDILVIEMKSGHSAVIDQSTLKHDSQDLTGIVAELDNQGVPSEQQEG